MRVYTISCSSGKYWLGLSDRIAESIFIWDNGEPLTYDLWESGQPNDAAQSSSEQDCAEINSNGDVEDTVCDELKTKILCSSIGTCYS